MWELIIWFIIKKQIDRTTKRSRSFRRFPANDLLVVVIPNQEPLLCFFLGIGTILESNSKSFPCLEMGFNTAHILPKRWGIKDFNYERVWISTIIFVFRNHFLDDGLHLVGKGESREWKYNCEWEVAVRLSCKNSFPWVDHDIRSCNSGRSMIFSRIASPNGIMYTWAISFESITPSESTNLGAWGHNLLL